MSLGGSDVDSAQEDLAEAITDALEPFPLFPVQALNDLTAASFMGLVSSRFYGLSRLNLGSHYYCHCS
jgi:hypothetical protein